MTQKLKIIGLCGELGAGKNYIATNVIGKIIKEFDGYHFIEVAFADFLKVECAYLHNDTDFLKATKSFKVRKELQNYGTLMRNTDINIWIKKLEYFMLLQQSKFEKVVFCITDVRYQNEIDFIKKYSGVLIKVYAPNRTKIRLEHYGDSSDINSITNHPSELTIRNVNNNIYDYIYDNSNNSTENQIGIVFQAIKLGLLL